MGDDNIEKLKVLAEQLVQFADFAELNSDDDRCFLLYGLTRDYGYRILVEAEKEWNNHAERRRAMSECNRGRERIA